MSSSGSKFDASAEPTNVLKPGEVVAVATSSDSTDNAAIFDINCQSVLESTPDVVKKIWDAIDFKIAKNWHKMAYTDPCYQFLQKNSHLLSDQNIRDILAPSMPLNDNDTPQDRLDRLENLGCFDEIISWNSIEMSQLSTLPNLAIFKLKRWFTLKPEVLQALSAKENNGSGNGYSCIIDPKDVDDVDTALCIFEASTIENEVWMVLTPELLGRLMGHSNIDHLTLMTALFCRLAREAQTPTTQVVVAMLMEVFLWQLLESRVLENAGDDNILMWSADLINARKHIADHSTSSLVNMVVSCVSFQLDDQLGKIRVQDTEVFRGFKIPSNADWRDFGIDDLYRLIENEPMIPAMFKTIWIKMVKETVGSSIESIMANPEQFNQVFDNGIGELIRHLESVFTIADYENINNGSSVLRLISRLLDNSHPTGSKYAEQIAGYLGIYTVSPGSVVSEENMVRRELIASLVEEAETFSLAFALVRTAKDVHAAGLASSYDCLEGVVPVNMENVHDSLDFIHNNPEVVASRNMRLNTHDLYGNRPRDDGGPSRQWITNILAWFLRPKDLAGNQMDPFVSHITNVDPIVKKLGWQLDRRLGGSMGIVFGKALQLKVMAPFEIESKFFALLDNDRSDGAARKYFRVTYAEDWERLRSGMVTTAETLAGGDAWNEYQIKKKLETKPAQEELMKDSEYRGIFHKKVADRYSLVNYLLPQHLVFRTFKGDFKYLDESDDTSLQWDAGQMTLEGVEALANLYRERIEDEFVEFVNEFRRGFAMLFRIGGIKYMRDLEIVSKMLCGFVISLQELEAIVRLIDSREEKTMYPSLIPGKQITINEILLSFFSALDEPILHHFIVLWTGSLSLQKLDVRITHDGNLRQSVTVLESENSCREPADPKSCKLAGEKVMMTPDCYCSIFQGAARYQKKLFKSDIDVSTLPAFTGPGKNVFFRTCSQELDLDVQSNSTAASLIYSLAFGLVQSSLGMDA